MNTFEFMGRTIGLTGCGEHDDPFVVTGTGYNPPLAAEIENYVIGKCLDGQEWHLKSTRLRSENGKELAALDVLLRVDGEIVRTEIWFDVTEAFSRQ